MNVHGLYVLWQARRNYFPHFPERTRKLGEDVSVETTSSTQGQGFATEVFIIHREAQEMVNFRKTPPS